MTEITDALGALLGLDVALESLGAHDLARTGNAEALSGALMSS